MLASFPYTTAMLLTLLDLMNCLSVLLSSSDTKPMKELSGVWAVDTKGRRHVAGQMFSGTSSGLRDAAPLQHGGQDEPSSRVLLELGGKMA